MVYVTLFAVGFALDKWVDYLHDGKWFASSQGSTCLLFRFFSLGVMSLVFLATPMNHGETTLVSSEEVFHISDYSAGQGIGHTEGLVIALKEDELKTGEDTLIAVEYIEKDNPQKLEKYATKSTKKDNWLYFKFQDSESYKLYRHKQ